MRYFMQVKQVSITSRKAADWMDIITDVQVKRLCPCFYNDSHRKNVAPAVFT